MQAYRLVHLIYKPEEFPKTPYPTRPEQALMFLARGYITSYDPAKGQADRIAPNALFGQQVGRLDFQCHVTSDFLMLQVIFQAGAMHRLLSLSSNELTGQYCDAELVLGSRLSTVNEQLANAKDYPAVIERVEEYMLSRLKKVKINAHPIDTIGQYLLVNPSSFSLDWLSDQACLSPRQFERKFNERMGIGPKLYSRVSRFLLALQHKEAHPELDWRTVAILFGYTDYDHLAKDFKQFSGVTPNLTIHGYTKRPEVIAGL